MERENMACHPSIHLSPPTSLPCNLEYTRKLLSSKLFSGSMNLAPGHKPHSSFLSWKPCQGLFLPLGGSLPFHCQLLQSCVGFEYLSCLLGSLLLPGLGFTCLAHCPAGCELSAASGCLPVSPWSIGNLRIYPMLVFGILA